MKYSATSEDLPLKYNLGVTLPDLQELCSIVKQTAIPEHSVPHASIVQTTKQDGSWVTDVDRRTQDKLLARLKQEWPQYGFIGEEMAHADQVTICDQSRQGYWVLDPLDGTTNFANGFPFYGVSLALVVDGHPQLGVVFDPVRDECFSAQRGKGAYLNQQRLFCPGTKKLGECIANIDYKRLVGDLAEQLVRSPPYRSQRNLGSSVLEWCWLAAGRFQLYLHGGQKLWDFSAGWLILTESGGLATSLSGKPLDCAKLRKRSVVAAVNADLLENWYDWINANSSVPESSPL